MSTTTVAVIIKSQNLSIQIEGHIRPLNMDITCDYDTQPKSGIQETAEGERRTSKLVFAS